ncbi:MAG: type II toxin-antitoxin system HicA family toxin [Syntrophobacteraceae bacterium]
MKIREIITLLKENGWFLVNQKGSHRQYKHPTNKGRVTVAGAFSDDVHPKTLKSILKQAGLER